MSKFQDTVNNILPQEEVMTIINDLICHEEDLIDLSGIDSIATTDIKSTTVPADLLYEDMVYQGIDLLI